MIDENTRKRLEIELTLAHEAIKNGNVGKARVCCRRIAGEIIAFAKANTQQPTGRSNALVRLESLSLDTSVRENVRQAAQRLRGKLHGNAPRPISTNPLDDLQVIVEHYIQTYGINLNLHLKSK